MSGGLGIGWKGYGHTTSNPIGELSAENVDNNYIFIAVIAAVAIVICFVIICKFKDSMLNSSCTKAVNDKINVSAVKECPQMVILVPHQADPDDVSNKTLLSPAIPKT